MKAFAYIAAGLVVGFLLRKQIVTVIYIVIQALQSFKDGR